MSSDPAQQAARLRKDAAEINALADELDPPPPKPEPTLEEQVAEATDILRAIVARAKADEAMIQQQQATIQQQDATIQQQANDAADPAAVQEGKDFLATPAPAAPTQPPVA